MEGEDKITLDLTARERRFYDRVRSMVVRNEPGSKSGIRDLVLLLPDLTVLLIRLMRDDRVPIGAKVLAAFGVAYVLSPIDIIPDILFAPIALLDDLFVVTAALSRILNGVHPDVVRFHWSGKGDVIKLVHRLTHWAETQVVSKVPKFFRKLSPF